MLPDDISPERFVRAVTTAAQIDPNLLATQFQSLWIACMRACRDGLLPDGVEGAIVAYKEKAAWIPMYRGLLKKVAPNLRWITANVVYDGEMFEHWIDEHGEHLRHAPSGEFDDGKVIRVYAMGETKTGGVHIAVLSLAEINKIRKMSRASRDDAPWNTWPTEMMKKTALRRLCKLLPAGIELPEETEDEETPKPVLAPVTPLVHGAGAALDRFANASSEATSDEDADARDLVTGESAVESPPADHDPGIVPKPEKGSTN